MTISSKKAKNSLGNIQIWQISSNQLFYYWRKTDDEKIMLVDIGTHDEVYQWRFDRFFTVRVWRCATGILFGQNTLLHFDIYYAIWYNAILQKSIYSW